MDKPPERPAGALSLSRKEIFYMVKGHLRNKSDVIIDILVKNIKEKQGKTIKVSNTTKPWLASLFSKLKTRWQLSRRHEVSFLTRNEKWLKTMVNLRIKSDSEPVSPVTTPSSVKKKRGGRPRVSFDSCSERTKRRKTDYLRSNLTVEELFEVIQARLSSSEQSEITQIFKDVTESSSKATDYLDAIHADREKTLSPYEALSVLIERRFSKSMYESIRNISKSFKCVLYPPYSEVANAKSQCFPPFSSITASNTSAEIKLQDLLNHTVKRILEFRSSTGAMSKDLPKTLRLSCKWGSGESPEHYHFKRKLFTSVVPLELVGTKGKGQGIVVWKNPNPASSRFCRPIRIQFLQENKTTADLSKVEGQIRHLQPFSTDVQGIRVTVTFAMTLGTIDANVCIAVPSVVERCFLCLGIPQEFSGKSSKKGMIQKVFNRLLVASDPYLCSVRKKFEEPLKPLVSKANNLQEPEDDEPEDEELNDVQSSASETESIGMYESEDEIIRAD